MEREGREGKGGERRVRERRGCSPQVKFLDPPLIPI